ncbi:chemosensory receptor c [Plakobranchus ocellatus]|uniref:Chemosensory receptor c n=1 Tax=Plakobranchus ocellatus TaxID=259542 RepID=A0AAV3YQZ3_9GAST|nr:chemosensory receptor c [Plakobranchus ocellatus]
MGLKDNVTTTLLALSVSDLINLILNCPTVAARIILEEQPSHNWPFDSLILIAGIYWYAYVFYDYSSFVSVFLAVVRCLCVAKPLAFKSLITKQRTLAFLITTFFTAVILRVPLFTVFRLASVKRSGTNSSFTKLVLSADYSAIHKANDIFHRTMISWLAYTTVIVCVVISLHKLKEAARFRRGMFMAKLDNHKASVTNQERSNEHSFPVSTISADTCCQSKIPEQTPPKTVEVIGRETLH